MNVMKRVLNENSIKTKFSSFCTWQCHSSYFGLIFLFTGQPRNDNLKNPPVHSHFWTGFSKNLSFKIAMFQPPGGHRATAVIPG